MQIFDLQKLTERLVSLVRRCHVTRNTNGPRYRTLHVQDWIDTDRQDIPHLQNAGFVSNAGSGSKIEAITLDVDADPSHSVAIVVTAEEEPSPDEGEAIMFSPKNIDNRITLTEDGICIEASGQELIQVLIEMATGLNPPQPQIVARLTAMKC